MLTLDQQLDAIARDYLDGYEATRGTTPTPRLMAALSKAAAVATSDADVLAALESAEYVLAEESAPLNDAALALVRAALAKVRR